MSNKNVGLTGAWSDAKDADVIAKLNADLRTIPPTLPAIPCNCQRAEVIRSIRNDTGALGEPMDAYDSEVEGGMEQPCPGVMPPAPVLKYGAEIVKVQEVGGATWDVRTPRYYIEDYSTTCVPSPKWLRRSEGTDRSGWFDSAEEALESLNAAPPPPGWSAQPVCRICREGEPDDDCPRCSPGPNLMDPTGHMLRASVVLSVLREAPKDALTREVSMRDLAEAITRKVEVGDER